MGDFLFGWLFREFHSLRMVDGFIGAGEVGLICTALIWFIRREGAYVQMHQCEVCRQLFFSEKERREHYASKHPGFSYGTPTKDKK